MSNALPSITHVQGFNFNIIEEKPTPPLLSRSFHSCLSVASRVAQCGLSAAKGTLKCSLSVATSVAKCAGKVLAGMGSVRVTAPLEIAFSKVVYPIIKKFAPSDTSAILEPICPGPAIAKVFNPICPAATSFTEMCRAFGKNANSVISDPSLNINDKLVIVGAFAPAILEEGIFRGILQDTILLRIPSYLIKKIAPGKETLLDSKIYTVARIVLASAIFSAVHLTNLGIFPVEVVIGQVAGSFANGIMLGTMKETFLGLPAAMGNHFAHNLVAFAPCFG